MRTRTDDVDSLNGVVLVVEDLGIASGGNDVDSFDLVLPPRPERLRVRWLQWWWLRGGVGRRGDRRGGGRMAREIYSGRCYF
ncbi:unnamed protein product [Urochloa humidicola]